MELEIGVCPLKIGKLEAGRRNLATAIELWFHDRDPVSIHSLAFAAYEVIHFVCKSRGCERDLLFDSAVVLDEGRGEWLEALKKAANFFKHANRDPDGVLEFNPLTSEAFMMVAIAAIELCGEKLTDTEATFASWTYVHRPEFLTAQGRKMLADSLSADHLDKLRKESKRDFFARRMRASSERRRLCA